MNISIFPRTLSKWSILVLLITIFLRAISLEYLDLLDPTEARYAAVAQNMVMSGNWITPTLPIENTTTPYLGKPPLYFWLTALSYKLFGFDEWSARLPSFLSALGILGLIMMFASRLLTIETGIAGCLIAFSSSLFFLLSGSSVVDVTLTFFVTLGLVYFALYLRAPDENARFNGLVIALTAALGFLTKGPVAIVLMVIPIILWSAIRRDFSWIRSYPWRLSTLLFSIVVIPWFILAERANPGFLQYFFWNENIARYLVHNYGDKYGSGHVHARGMSWLMFSLAFLPWTPLFILSLFKKGEAYSEIRRVFNSPWLSFLALWTITPLIFFTFARQLHLGYIIPSIPAASLLLAENLITSRSDRSREVIWNWLDMTLVILTLLCPLVGLMLGCSVRDAFLTLFISAIGFSLTRRFNLFTLKAIHSRIALTSTLSLGLYLVSTIVLAFHLNTNSSTEFILREIVNNSVDAVPDIGIMSDKNYSSFWAVNAWEEELGEPAHIRFINSQDISYLPKHLVVKAKGLLSLPSSVTSQYKERGRVGEWIWLEQLSHLV